MKLEALQGRTGPQSGAGSAAEASWCPPRGSETLKVVVPKPQGLMEQPPIITRQGGVR